MGVTANGTLFRGMREAQIVGEGVSVGESVFVFVFEGG